jgi:hypothetical protein
MRASGRLTGYLSCEKEYHMSVLAGPGQVIAASGTVLVTGAQASSARPSRQSSPNAPTGWSSWTTSIGRSIRRLRAPPVRTIASSWWSAT